MAGLSITDMDLTKGSRSVSRSRSISLRSVYESAASFISGLGSPTNYCAATRTGPGTIRRGCIGLDHVVGVSIWSYCICDWVTQVFELCMDPLCMDHWLRLA